MKTPATLNDLIAFQAPHQKGEKEPVGEFLKRRLIAHAESYVEEPHVSPAAIASACKLLGADPIQLILDQEEEVTSWDEPFRSHFFEDAKEWFVNTGLDDLMAQLDQHHERRRGQQKLVQATLDGKVRIAGDALAILR
ncbi:MAG: hypothetical protein ACK4FB_00245 [Brevundimonas sp.]|uniref:hypothetical protein n=1 Tax=Brevundimonas sp. TaxID=1871086 RepID=UPI003919EE43